MGALDQFAKQTFAEETADATHGAMAWEPPPELNLSEVRLDGMLLVRDPVPLRDLPAPWALATGHEQILVEAKMPGDHLGVRALERVLLRRQAWQVQRVEGRSPPWRGQVPVWLVAPRVPATLRSIRKVIALAPGCHAVETGPFSFVWIAANELPLREELIPFLIARSGRPLDDFARWVASRRPPAWVVRMVQIVPMSPDLREEMLRYVPVTDDPEVRARQRHVAKILLELDPDLLREITSDSHRKGVEEGLRKGVEEGLRKGVEEGLRKGVTEGIEEGLGVVYELRLGRPLTSLEHLTLTQRMKTLGPARLGSVVLRLSAAEITAWLADPTAG